MLWSVACSHCAHCARAASANEPVYYRGGKHMCDVYASLLCWVRFFAQLPNSTATTARPLWRPNVSPIVFGCFQIFFFWRFYFSSFYAALHWAQFVDTSFCCLGRLINFLFCNHIRHDSCAFCRSIAILGISFALFSIIFIWILFWFSRLPHKHLGNLCETYYKIIVEGYLSLQKYI